jgi:hypothetical protein
MIFIACSFLVASNQATAQDKIITIPTPVPGAPFQVEDNADLFGKAYRWFHDGELEWAADSLRKLLSLSDFEIDERNYYIVVANFHDSFTPVGMLHEGSAFNDTRLYGLAQDSLYYVFISKRENATSFLSTVLTAKASPFEENLLDFLSLFPQFPISLAQLNTDPTVWIDVRKFDIPEKFQKNCDISIIVRNSLDAEEHLATAVFDNTSLERWSYGIATAITTIDDVDFIIGEDGRIIVRPKPKGDLAVFGVINYHFKPVDTKAPTLASSFHLLGGLRIDNTIEPILGLGLGVPVGLPIEVHVFAGGSVQFANEIKSDFIDEFESNTPITEDVNPFKLTIRARPRFGIEIKFP